jgi:hypothetical protein
MGIIIKDHSGVIIHVKKNKVSRCKKGKEDQEFLSQCVKEFLASGGVITRLPPANPDQVVITARLSSK